MPASTISSALRLLFTVFLLSQLYLASPTKLEERQAYALVGVSAMNLIPPNT